jgi:hypothetical protein
MMIVADLLMVENILLSRINDVGSSMILSFEFSPRTRAYFYPQSMPTSGLFKPAHETRKIVSHESGCTTSASFGGGGCRDRVE